MSSFMATRVICGLYCWFTPHAIFARVFSQNCEKSWPLHVRQPEKWEATRRTPHAAGDRLFKQRKELRTLAVNLFGARPQMRTDDFPQRRMKLLPSPRVLTMKFRRVDVPQRRNIANGKPFLKSQLEKFDASPRLIPAIGRQRRLQFRRFAHDRPRERAVKDFRKGVVPPGHVGKINVSRRFASAMHGAPLLEPQRHVSHGPEQERPKPARSIALSALQHSPRSKTLEERLLNGVVQIFKSRRTSPPR
jgi:hypothetical protein